jgi:hypothetical protein
MLREAHRNQFSLALEVGGSGLGEQPPTPLRVDRFVDLASPLRAAINVRPLARWTKMGTSSIWCRDKKPRQLSKRFTSKSMQRRTFAARLRVGGYTA